MVEITFPEIQTNDVSSKLKLQKYKQPTDASAVVHPSDDSQDICAQSVSTVYKT